MSYNQFNLTFLERLETQPDSDEDVFSYYFSERMVINEYIDKVTRGELEDFTWAVEYIKLLIKIITNVILA